MCVFWADARCGETFHFWSIHRNQKMMDEMNCDATGTVTLNNDLNSKLRSMEIESAVNRSRMMPDLGRQPSISFRTKI